MYDAIIFVQVLQLKVNPIIQHKLTQRQNRTGGISIIERLEDVGNG